MLNTGMPDGGLSGGKTPKGKKGSFKSAKPIMRITAFMLAVALIFTVSPDAFAAEIYEGSLSSLLMVMKEEAARELSVTVFADGRIQTVAAEEETVGELLDRLDISLGERDIVEPETEAALEADMVISVTRVSAARITAVETIEHGQVRIANEYIPKGTENVLSEGSDGQKTVTYEITYKDGIEVSRSVISETVTVEAVDETVEYGSGGTIITPQGEKVKYSYKIDGQATAYTTEGYRWKYTRSGTVARVGAIAVDPSVIPLGTAVYVCSPDGGESWVYGTAVCEDTGGAIKGNIVDLFYNTRSECWQFGRRAATIYVLEGV